MAIARARAAALALACGVIACDVAPTPVDGWRGFADVSERVASPALLRTTQLGASTAALAALDLDHDGLLDLIATHDSGALVVLRNEGSLRFAPSDAIVGLDGVGRSSSLSAGDVDGDGDLDVLVGRAFGLTLFRDLGGGVFEDATLEVGLGEVDFYVSGASFADVDGDGRLDLYVCGYDDFTAGDWPSGLPNVLFVNVAAEEGARFVRALVSPGGTAEDIAATLASGWTDLDGDLRPDLVVINDFGPFRRPNQVFLNRTEGAGVAPRFESAGARLGLDQRMFGMGLAIADLDGDLRSDIYVTNAANNVLLVREGEVFVDRARERGAGVGHFSDPDPAPAAAPVWRDFGPGSERPMPEMVEFVARYGEPTLAQWTLTSWSPVPLDMDQDGDLDLFVTNGFIGLTSVLPEGPGQPNVLLANDDGAFAPVEEDVLRRVRGASRGAVAADFDRDGDLDVAWIDNGLDHDAGIHVLENLGAGGGSIAIELEGTRSNRLGIGAQVIVRAGDRAWAREVRTDVGLGSAVEPRVHVGVGERSEVDAIEIVWPSGTRQTLGPQATGSVVRAIEP